MLFLILLLSSCATAPLPTPEPIHWTFIDIVPGKTSACLPEEDVGKLVERLNRCEVAAFKCSQ